MVLKLIFSELPKCKSIFLYCQEAATCFHDKLYLAAKSRTIVISCNKRAHLQGFAPSLGADWFENTYTAFFWGASFLERGWGR